MVYDHLLAANIRQDDRNTKLFGSSQPVSARVVPWKEQKHRNWLDFLDSDDKVHKTKWPKSAK